VLDAVAKLGADHNLVREPGETTTPHGFTENLRRDEVLYLVRQWTADWKGSEA
jgi:hypothetical protein